MSSAKTNPARGMRDFLPSDVRKRNYVINIIKEVYESYGFEPLETPSVENLETLTGKYGEEGNQLIFKILKRGEKLQEELASGAIKSENELSDLALRYDLTVPLARVVANHKNDLPKFFKRYQIQPVWRADRPARGRYREFYQCDVDAIGSSSMMVEAELCAAVCEILERLGFSFVIQINHRQILTALLNSANIPKDKHNGAITALDKFDKFSDAETFVEAMKLDLTENFWMFVPFFRSVLEERRKIIKEFTDGETKNNRNVAFRKYNERILEIISNFIKGEEERNQTLSDIKKILGLIQDRNLEGRFLISPVLARGLSYYTGAIMEINVDASNEFEDFNVSIGGGGRYDGLIGMFGKEQIPACGFSLGLERILVVMEERGMFPAELSDASADVMVTVWNEESIGESLKLAAELRSQKLRVLVYPEADKLGKQFKYADSIKIPFVCVLGETELAENKVTLKNLQTGEQETVSREEIAAKVGKI